MKIQFVSLCIPPFWEQESLLLTRSLRLWGGELAASPLTVLTLSDRPLPAETAAELVNRNASLVAIDLDPTILQFPLGLVPLAAGEAEARLEQAADLLVWLLPDTLILNPPTAFVLPADKTLGYRPVHHQNIGSPSNQAPDPFWRLIYQHCQVPEQRLFEMQTCYREILRPYFNAGCLVTRPQAGILQAWRECFVRLYQHPDFQPFYQQQKYAVFMHQAVLIGVILNHLAPDALFELPEQVNYPLHLHSDYPPAGKIASLAELVTARYERAADLPALIEPLDGELQRAVLLASP